MQERKGVLSIAAIIGIAVVALLVVVFWPIAQDALAAGFSAAPWHTKALLAALPAFIIFVVVSLPFVLSETPRKRPRQTERRGRR